MSEEEKNQQAFLKQLKKDTDYIAKECLNRCIEYAKLINVEPFYILEKVRNKLDFFSKKV